MIMKTFLSDNGLRLERVKGCLPQILLDLFLSTLSHVRLEAAAPHFQRYYSPDCIKYRLKIYTNDTANSLIMLVVRSVYIYIYIYELYIGIAWTYITSSRRIS